MEAAAQDTPGARVAAEPALLQTFPELGRHLPREPFVSGPTPVRALALEGLESGRGFVKDDSRSSPFYGGNKPRKLEWVIGAARARGARRLVTTGGLGSHHGLATAILGRRVGLATTLVLVDQPWSPEVRETLLLQAAWGAEQVVTRGVSGAALGVVGALVRSGLRGERPALVPTGGSSVRGGLGFVSAGLELAAQVRAGSLPEPASIWVPVGSGGTVVGLVVGLRLAGLASRVVGVLVNDILPPSPRSLARRARRVLHLLRRHAPRIPQLSLRPDEFRLVRSQLGPGYGAPTAACREAQGRAREAGLALETTYGAKALAALLEAAGHGTLPPGPVLFWHTYNAVDVRASAPCRPEDTRLPAALRARFSDEDAAEG